MLNYQKFLKLNETLGVPDFVDDWSDVIKELIVDQIEQFVDELEEDTETTEISIYGEPSESYSKTVFVPPSIIKSRIHNLQSVIDVKKFELQIKMDIVSDEVFDSDYQNAHFDSDAFIFTANKLKNVELYVNILMPDDIINSEDVYQTLVDFDIISKIDEMLAHELTHFYEFYKKNNDMTTDRMMNDVLSELKDRGFVSDDWSYFLNLVYLSLSFENNARVAEIDARVKNRYENSESFTVKDFLNVVHSSSAWDEMKRLKEFDSKKFMEEFELDDDIQKEFKNKGVEKSMLLSHLLSEWNEILKKVVKYWESESVDIKKELNLEDNKYIKEVPKEFLNNPSKFFKYFEKRFKRKHQDFERKVMRLVARYKIDK